MTVLFIFTNAFTILATTVGAYLSADFICMDPSMDLQVGQIQTNLKQRRQWPPPCTP